MESKYNNNQTNINRCLQPLYTTISTRFSCTALTLHLQLFQLPILPAARSSSHNRPASVTTFNFSRSNAPQNRKNMQTTNTTSRSCLVLLLVKVSTHVTAFAVVCGCCCVCCCFCLLFVCKCKIVS